MGNSWVTEGNVIEWANATGSDVDVNEVVLLGMATAGVAQVDIANGAIGTVSVTGVHRLGKFATDNAIAQNAPVYFNMTTQLAYNAPSNGLVFVGFAAQAAAATATTVQVKLAPFGDEPPREITLAATGNQILGAANFYNGKALVVKVPNTAALTVTFPLMATVPKGVVTSIQKTSADVFVVTVAANASNTLVGTVGTIDAATDRATLITTTTGPWIMAASIIA